MNELTDLNLDALRIELAYRRALLTGDAQPTFRARLPRQRSRRFTTRQDGRN